MDYHALARALNFSPYNPVGFHILPDGRLLLKVSERSNQLSKYSDLIDRRSIEFAYDGHIEGRRGSRNGRVRTWFNNSPDATPRVVLAIGLFQGEKKQGKLAWTYSDDMCLRGIVDKGIGASPKFMLNRKIILEWDRFSNITEED